MRAPHRLALALVLVGVGSLLSPGAVPVYDGIGAPDEPYRYVAAPAGYRRTAEPTTARATSPVARGVSQNGMSIATAEVGPQFSLFVPPQALATSSSSVAVTVTPQAPADQPGGARIDGNAYEVSFVAKDPVTLTQKAGLATLYLRATTAKQPPPVMEHRARASDPWKPLKTLRGGQDVYVSSFPGPGLYALAFTTRAPAGGGGSSPWPWVALGGLVLLVVVVVVVRVRSAS